VALTPGYGETLISPDAAAGPRRPDARIVAGEIKEDR
jgi:hypothetical protein